MPVIEALRNLTDILPGGDRRQRTRQETRAMRDQVRAAKAAKHTHEYVSRPWWTRAKIGAFVGAGVLTLISLNDSGGDKVIGQTANDVTSDAVGGIVDIGGAAKDILGGAASGVKDGVLDNVDTGIEFQSPIVVDGNGTETSVSQSDNTTLVPTSEISAVVPSVVAEQGDSAWSTSRECLGETPGNPLPAAIVKEYVDLKFIPVNGSNIVPGNTYQCP